MPRLSNYSQNNLNECHPDLQRLIREVAKHINIRVIKGHRGKEEQNEAFQDGTSHIEWPNGMHNKKPSLAVDVVPYPIDWNTPEGIKRFYYLAGFILATGIQLGIKVRLGADWNGNHRFYDQTLHDLPHVELIPDK